jgi:hypothetical protein
MRALVLGSFVPQTARLVWRWLAAGHEIDEIWLPENSSGVWRRRDRRLRWLAPTWSLTAAVRRFGLRVRAVGPLSHDPQTAGSGCRRSIDVVLSACFPHIVPREMLAYYDGRAFNLHPSLLPRYAGPRPMAAMVFDEALDAAGVTLHMMTPKLDAGDVIAQQPVAWPADGWYRTWEADLAEAGARLAVESLPRFMAGQLAAQPQHGPRHYVKRLPAGGLTLNQKIDEQRTRWLCGSLGRVMPLSLTTDAGQVAVGGVLATHGSPKGEAPRVGWGRVECDFADARLVLRRWDRLHRRAERLRELAALVRRPMAA